MTAVPEAESTHQPVKSANAPSTFNFYPLLGILLVIVAAAVVYGGVLLFLIEEWMTVQPVTQGAAPA